MDTDNIAIPLVLLCPPPLVLRTQLLAILAPSALRTEFHLLGELHY